MKGNFCTVRDFKPSARTLETIKEMNRVTDMATLLGTIMTFIPLFQIFAGRKTYPFASNGNTKKLQIANSDWKTFADALSSVPKVERLKLEQIALGMELLTTGEERKFWGCVSNAL